MSEAIRASYDASVAESLPLTPPPRKVGICDTDNLATGSEMGPRRQEVDVEEFTTREMVHNLMLAQTSFYKTMETQATRVNGNGRWTGWIQTGVICGMLLVTGTNTFKSSEATLQGQITAANNAVQEAKRDASDAAKEARKANLNNALLDTYNRELERALIRRGIILPTYPVLEK